MEKKPKRLYEFDRFCVDPEESVLLHDGKPVYLKPKVFETLMVLVENRGRIMDKEALMQRLWQDTFVEEANLTVNISQLRKALGQTDDGFQFIETLPRRGYRFAADVREVFAHQNSLVVEEYISSRITIEESETEGKTGIAVASASAAPLAIGTVAEAKQIPATQLSWYRKPAFVAIVSVILAGLIWGIYQSLSDRSPASQEITLTRLTHVGRVLRAAISGDGKYVAYVAKEAGGQSMWLRQVATAANVQIVPAAGSIYWGLAFSPDASHIFFVKADSLTGPSLYKVAVLGGPIQKLRLLGRSSFAISPSGNQFAYIGEMEQGKETSVIIANADGSGERVIATRKAPDFFYSQNDAIAWSPNGKVIACHAGGTDEDGYYRNVVAVQVEDGSEKPITSKRWKWIGGLGWLADGDGLLLSASDEPAGWDVRQIWRITYPDGEARKITNDLSGYTGISLTRDNSTAITIQETQLSSIWLLPAAELSQAKRLTAGDADGPDGLAWTPDGRIVYTSKAGGRNDLQLWIMNSDGSNQKQLTASPGVHEEPSVSANGRFIVYAARAPNDLSANIWRIDIDGGNPKQLTRGGHDVRPQCSPDGKWVVYPHRVTPVTPTLWKVPIEGGEAVQLHDGFTFGNGLSPDARLIACGYAGDASNGHNKIALIPFEGGPPVRLFDMPPGVSPYDLIQWAPDGKVLTCGSGGTTKIWSQPLDGSSAKELIDFQSDSAWRFAWSPQGKDLAVARGSVISNVVLIGNLK